MRNYIMTKIEKRLKHTEQNNRRHVWPQANHFYYTEMLPLLDYVGKTGFHLVQLFNKTFKKYLIISCLGLIDNYMTLQIRKFVDEQHINISKLKLHKKYEKILVDHPDVSNTKQPIS